jgi:hypothetical protein
MAVKFWTYDLYTHLLHLLQIAENVPHGRAPISMLIRATNVCAKHCFSQSCP